jgi:hypothetical protein
MKLIISLFLILISNIALADDGSYGETSSAKITVSLTIPQRYKMTDNRCVTNSRSLININYSNGKHYGNCIPNTTIGNDTIIAMVEPE